MTQPTPATLPAAQSSPPAPDRFRATLRGVALFEGAKGVAALAGLLGLLGLLHHDLHHLALELIGHFGLNPSHRYPALLLQAVDKLNATPISTVALLGSLYVAARAIESWGLWHDKAWGEWFGAISGGMYIPFEVRHVLHEARWQGVLVLLFNVALVVVLLVRLRQRARNQDSGAAHGPQSNLTRGSTHT